MGFINYVVDSVSRVIRKVGFAVAKAFKRTAARRRTLTRRAAGFVVEAAKRYLGELTATLAAELAKRFAGAPIGI